MLARMFSGHLHTFLQTTNHGNNFINFSNNLKKNFTSNLTQDLTCCTDVMRSTQFCVYVRMMYQFYYLSRVTSSWNAQVSPVIVGIQVQ
jgi:hypothetical protein